MKPSFRSFVLPLLLISVCANAQEKRVLDHDVYTIWQNISHEKISRHGEWALYTLAPQEGDPALVVRHLQNGREHRVPQGTRGQFTYDATHVIFFLEPPLEEVRTAKKADKKKDDLPKNALGILDLATGAVERIERVKSFALPEEAGGWVAWLHEKPLDEKKVEEDTKREESPEEVTQPVGEEPAGVEPGTEGPAEPEAVEPVTEPPQPVGEEPMPVEPEIEPEPSATPVEPTPPGEPVGLAAEPKEADEDKKDKDEKPEGRPLVLRNLGTGEEQRFENVTEYVLAKNGTLLVYTASNKEGDADGAFAVLPESGDVVDLLTGEGIYKQVAIDDGAQQVAILSNRDTFEDDQPEFRLYLWNAGEDAAEEAVSEETPGLPAGWWVGEHRAPWFSEDGTRVYFGTAPRPKPDPDEDSLPPDDERVKVDVWSWTDDYLQPMQLVQRADEEKRSYLAVRHRDDARVVQLGHVDWPEIETAAKGGADVALAESNAPYRKALSWEYPRSHDYVIVDLRTGDTRPVLEGHLGTAKLSPAGKYVYWWDRRQRAWFARPTDGGEAMNLTGALGVAFEDEDNDRPMTPDAYGDAGWTKDDGAFVVYDRYDLWRLDPRGESAPLNLTEGAGRTDNRRFRVVDLDPEEDFLPDELLLRTFDYGARGWGFHAGRSDAAAAPHLLHFDAKLFSAPVKADDAPIYLLTRQSFEEFPDLWWTSDTFEELHRVSDANPQQAEYRWGTAELVSWDSVNGERLDGILYKPEDFDPEKKHPLLVYFYERLSDRLHAHHTPEANRASINASFYVSRGYCVFMPDIPYRLGYPGESALHAVVPGVLSLLEQGFVDRDRIGLQGHSWGGYQTAYIITQTPMFAAAEAGAPVSNMISAYGGIRWETGMSRMFQYERTQSRIGEPLWDAPLHYIENSPIFFADKVETPLLMLHNDADGAVPWYQGIELFTALRRLDKPVWLLNYNGEAHGLTKTHNKIDWAKRMQQFFDHYLMDAPAPVWMTEGVPAVDKGKTLGLDLPAE